MPRSSRSGGARPAPTRPTGFASAKPTPAPQQTRPASTVAAPPQQQAPPAQAAPSQGPGLFGQMASTAAGVAIGSSVGHAIGGFFSGGSSSEPAQAQQSQVQAAQPQTYQSQEAGANCAPAAQQFTKCMDDHQGNMQICNWYLEQLKACQAAASQY